MLFNPEDIINFWFNEVGPDRWFKPDASLDEAVRANYADVYEQAVAGQFKKWQETPEGMLGLLLLLHQFPRRIFRGTAKAYATDDWALDLARAAIIKHFDDRIDRSCKLVFYLPFSHAENMGDQRLGIFYIRERTKDDVWLAQAEQRYQTIQHFGRFPHRNVALGRESTPEELAFLAQAASPLQQAQMGLQA